MVVRVGSEEYKEIMRQAYSENFLNIIDIVGREGFYGVVAGEAIGYLGDKLNLSRDSHLLDLCSGIGGPARFLAKRYGCEVVGIDINEFSYQVALDRTKRDGLSDHVSFICGNALEIPFDEETFTHVFGCDAWSYFPEKTILYGNAYKVLKPKGLIAFFDIVKTKDVVEKSYWETLWGSYYPETLKSQISMLEDCGFTIKDHQDSTDMAVKETLSLIRKLVKIRDRIISSAGQEAYYAVLETWVEILTDFKLGDLRHYYIVAQK